MANFKEFVATGEEPVGKYMEFSVEVLPDGITSAIPDGWEICNGAEISRQDYADLFEIIGTTFGSGNGSDTFNLPDFRGKFLRGHGGSGNHVSGSIGSTQNDAFTSHDHPASSTGVGNHTHSYNDRFTSFFLEFDVARGTGLGQGGSRDVNTGSGGAHNHTITVENRGDNETRPINMAAVICIKV
jgi:hypothetical protein